MSIPETGTEIDFKHALLDVIPAVPRYPKRRWTERFFQKWAIIFNGTQAIVYTVILGIELWYHGTDWASWLRTGLSAIQLFMCWLCVQSHNRAEDMKAELFTTLADCHEQAKDNGLWMTASNVQCQMANLIRRQYRRPFSDLYVRIYNHFNLKTEKCPCCLQISHGRLEYRNETSSVKTLYVFGSQCPFCQWKW